MAYLSNISDEIVIGAVLTQYGRKKLSEGKALGISKFALSDDEVDYNNLWNSTHPNGEQFHGIAIQKMPILEAPSYDPNAFRYTLFTGERRMDITYIIQPNTPTEFLTGIWRPNTYSFMPTLYPLPTDKGKDYWFKLEIFPDDSHIWITGIVDSTRPYSQALNNSYKEWEDLGGMMDIDVPWAVGHAFNVVINNVPIGPITYAFKLTVFGTDISAAIEEFKMTLSPSAKEDPITPDDPVVPSEPDPGP